MILPTLIHFAVLFALLFLFNVALNGVFPIKGVFGVFKKFRGGGANAVFLILLTLFRSLGRVRHRATFRYLISLMRSGIYSLISLMRSGFYSPFSRIVTVRKLLLVVTFIYVSIFLNVRRQDSNSKLITCPNGYAYLTELGGYIRCEDFDEYYASEFNGVYRHDLVLNSVPAAIDTGVSRLQTPASIESRDRDFLGAEYSKFRGHNSSIPPTPTVLLTPETSYIPTNSPTDTPEVSQIPSKQALGDQLEQIRLDALKLGVDLYRGSK